MDTASYDRKHKHTPSDARGATQQNYTHACADLPVNVIANQCSKSGWYICATLIDMCMGLCSAYIDEGVYHFHHCNCQRKGKNASIYDREVYYVNVPVLRLQRILTPMDVRSTCSTLNAIAWGLCRLSVAVASTYYQLQRGTQHACALVVRPSHPETSAILSQRRWRNAESAEMSGCECGLSQCMYICMYICWICEHTALSHYHIREIFISIL